MALVGKPQKDHPDQFKSLEEVRAFLFLLETKYGNNVARAFAVGRLRSRKFIDDFEQAYLEEKIHGYKLEEHS